MIRAVVFDVGGVLVREQPLPVLWRQWSEPLGVPDTVVGEGIAAIDPEEMATVGRLGEHDFFALVGQHFGVAAEVLTELRLRLWDWYCSELDDDMAGLAEALRRRGCRTAILSNSFDGARREEQARYGFAALFDPIVYSHEVGLAKPDPAVYAVTTSLLGVRANEVLFIDDRVENIEAATRFGWSGIVHHDVARTLQLVAAAVDAG